MMTRARARDLMVKFKKCDLRERVCVSGVGGGWYLTNFNVEALGKGLIFKTFQWPLRTF